MCSRVRERESLEAKALGYSQAVEAYRQALTVYTREALSQQWALTQNNLGAVLTSEGERVAGAEGVGLLTQAVEAYHQALTVRTRKQFPQDWATTQNNLGAVLRRQGERVAGAEGVGLLTQAVEAYRQALIVRTREHFPQDWATTQSNLANVLTSEGERVAGAEGVGLLTQAVEAYHQALTVRTREQLPQQWAETQNNLGNVLTRQGERVDGTEGVGLLTQAVEASRQALTVRTREALPQQWATTQDTLGVALTRQGERVAGTEGIALLTQAVEALRQALTVRTREALPQQWATTQNNLAEAYFLLQNWADAAEAYTNALTAYADNERAYSRMSAIYHVKLFKFDKAFALDQQWLARHPDDLTAQARFAEGNFTTGHFTESSQRINALLAKPEVAAKVRTALRAIEIANLLALEQSKSVAAKLEMLMAEVSSQPADFNLTWSFEGTRHFIGQSEKLSPYRAWLMQLFAALASPTRDQIIKGLNETKAAFK